MILIAGLWAFAEATFFFILPDFFILPAVIARPAKPARFVVAALAGSLVGSLTLAFAAHQAPEATREFITALPFTTSAMFDTIAGTTASASSVVTQPVSGVPAKVWVWTAVQEAAPLVPFFAVMMAARLLRFAAVAALGRILAATCGPVLRRHSCLALSGYSVAFVIGLAVVAELR